MVSHPFPPLTGAQSITHPRVKTETEAERLQHNIESFSCQQAMMDALVFDPTVQERTL